MALVAQVRIGKLLRKSRLQMHAAVWLQIGCALAAMAAGALSPIGVRLGTMDLGTFIIVVVGIAWFSLLARSLKQGQMLHQAARLVSQDRRSQAVPFLVHTLEGFTLLRLNKMLAMIHLAKIAHDQEDHATTAALAGEVLRHDLARRKGLTLRASLLLADSLMERGDADEAGEALGHLHGCKLRLAERLAVLPVLLRWQMIAGKYAAAVAGLDEKVQMAALLDAPQACLVHVLLAAAARYEHMKEISRFLLRRAALHYDLDLLAQQNPSAASYLVQMQVADEATGRRTHGHLACRDASSGVQQAVETADPL